MKKILALSGLLSAVLYSGTASSRICFALDENCQNAGFTATEVSVAKCDDVPDCVLETEICYAKEAVSQCCIDGTGSYYKTKCKEGWCDLSSIYAQNISTIETALVADESTVAVVKARATSSSNISGNVTNLGALASVSVAQLNSWLDSQYTYTLACEDCIKDIQCNANYVSCEKLGKITPTSGARICYKYDECERTNNTLTHKNDCICDTSKYPYTSTNCGSDGLVLAGNSCTDSEMHYEKCECAAGYSESDQEVTCSTCNYGYTGEAKNVQNPSGGFCYTCPTCLAPTCANLKDGSGNIKYGSGYADFDAYWAGYDYPNRDYNTKSGTCENLVVDCETLGYSTTRATGVTCSNGTEPFRCPFDHEKTYCPPSTNKIQTELDISDSKIIDENGDSLVVRVEDAEQALISETISADYTGLAVTADEN